MWPSPLTMPMFQDMHADKCGSVPGLCDAMDPYDGVELKRYLLKVNFTGNQINDHQPDIF